MSMFIVEKGAPGFAVGRALEKTGWRSSDTAELVFDGCRIPADQLLGAENAGFYALMQNFQRERIALAAMATGQRDLGAGARARARRSREAFGGVLWDQRSDPPAARAARCADAGAARVRVPLRVADHASTANASVRCRS